ncbi:MAG TPA: ankyrin repeat domain-containing protein [Candidatus Rifleibacterium sp.]|nr:ankyrin repeat domain-containing protein [Candidatus Rifleibacterium sp.]HPT44949.1 ankyrin repeat domain-containing protein [Candidatus Rifleibacterium sp.]
MAGKRHNKQDPGCGFYLLLIVIIALNAYFDSNDKKSGSGTTGRAPKTDAAVQLISDQSDEDLLAWQKKGRISSIIDHGKGRTALHVIAQLNRHEILKQLLARGEPPSPRDKGNATPLHLALENGHSEAAGLLLRAGADLLAVTTNGYSILHHAARYGNYEVAKAAIKAGANLSAEAYAGFTPLHYAAREKHLKIAILLCENGANTDARINYGWTPGDLAFSKSPEITRYLHSRGAYFSQHVIINEFKLVDGWPFFAEDQIIAIPDDEDPVFKAIDADAPEELARLHNDKCNLKITSKAGTPALCLAIANKKLQAADYLLKNAADLEAADANGRNALLYAIEFRQPALAKEIIKRKPNLSQADQSGNTALHYALASSQNELAVELIDHGADIFAENNFSRGMIHIASENSNSMMFEILISNGCDVNKEDIHGNTPLHLAAKSDNIAIIAALLKNGADFSAVNNKNLKPEQLAKSDAARALLSNRFEIEGQNPAERQKPAEVNILPLQPR